MTTPMAGPRPTWSTWSQMPRVVLYPPHLASTGRIALAVGTVLFAINQLDVVLRGEATAGTWLKVGVTYLVPVVVSSLGVLAATRERDAAPPPALGAVDVSHLAMTVLQLALLAFALWALEIEAASGFTRFVPFLGGAWAVHYVLPARFQPSVFLAFSVAAFVAQLGTAAGWVLLLGLGLVGIAHLPVRLSARVALFAAATAILVALRAGYGGFAWAAVALPALASIFMFRMMLYVIDPGRADIGWATRLSYFFMLPNAFFPVFPIVDWAAFRAAPRTPLHDLHRRGIQWIARGIVHVLLYRIVYHLVLPADWEIVDAGSVFRWVFAIYLLYLRMSGQYHIIGGVLLLFGYDLPETHHLYYFSTGFSDFWRRTNIYWTQFMQKVVFFPVFLGLRRAGLKQPMVPSILALFAITWLLHGGQWFFLAGRWAPTWTDSIFWAVLGLCVAANAVLESGRKPPAGARSFEAMVLRSVQTVAFFCAMSLLWTFWYTESPGRFAENLLLVTVRPEAFYLLAAGVLVAVAGGVVLQALVARPEVVALLERADASRRPALALASCGALALLAAAVPRTTASDPTLERVRAAIAGDHLNEQDMLAKTRGYYEVLQPKASPTANAWTGAIQAPPDWVPLARTELVRRVPPPLEYEIVPSAHGTFLRQPMATNSHGLRDREYALAKPPRTYRIALLGASYEMGSGVPDGESYEARAEARLNDDFAGQRYDRYEILNFGVAGYTTPQVAATYAAKARAFAPDLVLCAHHSVDLSRSAQHLAAEPSLLLRSTNPTLRRAGERLEGASPLAAERWIRDNAETLTTALWRQVSEEAASDGARAVWLFVPITEEDPEVAATLQATHEAWARAAGMLPISLRGAYGDLDTAQLAVAPWDAHPNAAAHQLLADRLVEALVEADRTWNLEMLR